MLWFIWAKLMFSVASPAFSELYLHSPFEIHAKLQRIHSMATNPLATVAVFQLPKDAKEKA